MKVGDRISNCKPDSNRYGWKGFVTEVDNQSMCASVEYDNGYTGSGPYKYYQVISSKTLSMSLISKFKNITRKEPERTFVKAGVMNESLELTSEGTALFLSYMLEKNKDDFKKEVVDPIVAEMDKEESK